MQPLIAGRGWRALVIGAALKDVVAELGATSHTRKFDDFIAVDWRPLGIKAYLDLDERVTIVTAVFREIYVEGFTPFAATTEHGIGGDASPEQIEAAHGPAPERRGNKGDILVYEGLLFSFYEGALHEITIDPTNRPMARPSLPPPPPLNELGRRALELVADLERRLAALARPNVRLVFTPAEPAWLDNFEHLVGHRLPPSYRQTSASRAAA